MSEDSDLLRRYHELNDAGALGELVQRRVGLVYGVALRCLHGDSQGAQDVAQQVFIDLVRKAGGLTNRPVLAGWLCRSAHLAALAWRRAEGRRKQREHDYAMETASSTPDTPWENLRPELDEALAELDEKDRDALALRFFDHCAHADVAARLRVSENAARMRVDRALDKLRERLARRGIDSTAAAIGVALTASAGCAAPAGLAATIATAAAVPVAGAGTGLLLWGGLKLPLAGTAALVSVGSFGLWWAAQSEARLREELARLRDQTAAAAELRPQIEQLTAQQTEWRHLKAEQEDWERLQAEVAAAQQREAEARKAEEARTARASGEVIYSLRQLDRAPRPTGQKAPVYPFKLRLAGMTGDALVGFVIRSDGTIREEEVLSTTHAEFGEAALQAVKQWTFSPGQKAGLPVNVRVQVPIVFSISNEGLGPQNWF